MSELINNRKNRIRNLKTIIRKLHEGADPETVKGQLEEIVRETDASEIAAMEQELIAEGMKAEEIQSMCDLHAQVLREIIAEPQEVTELAPGHPVDTFRRENKAIAGVVERMRKLFDEACASESAGKLEELFMEINAAYNELMDIDKHYKRKEYLLFSRLERHGVTGPSQVMWGKHDEAREMLKALGEALSSPIASNAEAKRIYTELAQPALEAVEGMIYKEEQILLPMSLEMLTNHDWGEIWKHSPEYGWCLVEPREGYKPPLRGEEPEAAEIPEGRALIFPNGSLDPDQLRGLFEVLPVDLTFVDHEDRVRFFSESKNPVFSRSKAIIGRRVQHCHPPKSVHTVEQIISDFRSGKEDVAEFWIQMRGKFVHIRYFAVRNPEGEYIGTLEVTMDITRLRALEGERRLLNQETGQ